MWTGGKPPRIPTTSGNGGGTTNKGTKMVQNKAVDAELEALKQRGLAKILNKHFTETTARLAAEKAAADAAIQDLEERKARTSEFTPSGDLPLQLSPLDEMRVKANQWRAECRRKERETLLLYQRYVNKFGDTGVCAIDPTKNTWVPPAKPDTNKTAAPPPKSPPKLVPSQQVPSMAKQIEATLEEYLKQGGVSLPSAITHGKELTYQTLHEKEIAEFRAYYRKKLEERGVDAKSSLRITEQANFPGYFIPPDTEVDPFQRTVNEDIWKSQIEAAVLAAEHASLASGNNTTVEQGSLPIGTINEDDDMCSVVSGLTTLHSAMTREVLHECERSVAEFLLEEQANIRKIMSESPDSDSNNDSTIAGYTVGDASMRATEEAENMVQQMEEILSQYQSQSKKQRNNKSNNDNDDSSIFSTNTPRREPRKYDTGNPDECWMVYYDEFYQQEYYHEKNSNRTQWDPPGSASATDSSSDTDVFSLILPESSVSGSYTRGSTSRVAAYRRKRRRARRRKFIILLTILMSLGGIYYYILQHPSVQNGNLTPIDALKDIVQTHINEWTGINELKRLHEEELLKRRVEEEIIKREKEIAQRKLQEQQEEDARRKDAEEKLKIVENEKRLAIERAAEKEAAAIEREREANEKEEKQQQQKALMHRPWACNLPLAYIFHSRCRKLATTNPIFDLHALIQSMLQ